MQVRSDRNGRKPYAWDRFIRPMCLTRTQKCGETSVLTDTVRNLYVLHVRYFVLLCLHVTALVCKSKKSRRDAAVASPNDDSKMFCPCLKKCRVLCSEKERAYALVGLNFDNGQQ